MKKILLTGAGGFIGRNIAESLKDEYQLHWPSRKELNLLDQEAVQGYLKQYQFDVVIHSANCNDTRRKITPYDALDGNLRMFFNLERCHSLYGKLIYFGSGAEYARDHYIPGMAESYFGIHVPMDAYGFSKYIMAKTCESSRNIYELCLFGVYGKYEEWERRFISNAICRVLKGKDITIRQNVYFDYLWVEDLVQIVRWFIEGEPLHRRYNVCRGQKADLYSLAVTVREILCADCDIIVAKEGWKPEYTGDNNRLLEEMGGFRFTALAESIRLLCDYYRANEDRIEEERLI